MTIKQERVRDLLMNHLSSILLFETTDPALQGITVTDLKLDRELQYADIYVHALGDESREAEVLKGLKRATGFLRSSLAKQLRLKQIPVLHFHWDRMIAAADHIESLLDSLNIPKDSEQSSPADDQ